MINSFIIVYFKSLVASLTSLAAVAVDPIACTRKTVSLTESLYPMNELIDVMPVIRSGRLSVTLHSQITYKKRCVDLKT